jgi:hypothetical protein
MERSCIRCDEHSTIVVIQVGAVEAFLDLCEDHVAELLRGSRRLAEPVKPGSLDPGRGPRRPPRMRRGRVERLAP